MREIMNDFNQQIVDRFKKETGIEDVVFYVLTDGYYKCIVISFATTLIRPFLSGYFSPSKSAQGITSFYKEEILNGCVIITLYFKDKQEGEKL